MSIIKDVQDSNDPQLDKFNNEDAPKLAPVIPTPQPTDAGLSLGSTPVGVNPQAVIETESTPQPLTPEQQALTDSYNEASRLTTNVQPMSELVQPQQALPTPTNIDSQQPTVFESANQFNLSATDNLLQQGKITQELINETQLTQSHIPTVYSTPYDGDEWDLDFEASLERAGVLPGQKPSPETFNSQFNAQPTNEDASRSFNPNALKRSQFDVEGALAAIRNINTQEGLTGYQTIKPWGEGALSSLMYGLGVVSNTIRGGVIDAVNVRNRVVNQLPKPIQGVLNFNPASALTGQQLIRPDANYRGSYTLDAIRGRQYSFTANSTNKDEPIGITGFKAFDDLAERMRQNRNARYNAINKTFGREIAKPVAVEERWSTDLSFWAGFGLDTILDPIDSIGVAWKASGLLLGNAPSYVKRGIPTNTGRVIVTPAASERKLLPPGRTRYTPPGKPDGYELGLTEPLTNNKYQVVQTPKGEVSIPVGQPTVQAKLPSIASNNKVTSLTLRREIRRPDGVIDVEFTPNPGAFDRVTGISNEPLAQLPSSEARRPLEPTQFETIQTPNGEVQVPINQPSAPRQLPGTRTYSQPNWRWSRVVDGYINPEGMQPIIEVVRRKPEVFTTNSTSGYSPNWEYWSAPKVDDLYIPAPIDVEFKVIPNKPSNLPLKPSSLSEDIVQGVDGEVRVPSSTQPNSQLALPYGEPYPLTQWDLSLETNPPQIGQRIDNNITVAKNQGEAIDDVINNAPRTVEYNVSGLEIPRRNVTPQGFPKLEPRYDIKPPETPRVIELAPESVTVIREALDSNDWVKAYDELLRKRVPVSDIKRKLETGRIDEAVNDLRKLIGDIKPKTAPEPKPVAPKRQRRRVIKADGTAVYETVRVNPETQLLDAAITNINVVANVVDVPSMSVSQSTPASPLAIDAASDALRPVSPGTPLVAPTSEVNKQLVDQLTRLTETERMMKRRGASPETLERIRTQKLELRKAIADGDELAEPKVKPEPVTPAINKTVLTGTMTMSELSQQLLDNVPGSRIDPDKVRRVERKLSEVEALMKVIPNPITGEPLLGSANTRKFRTWAKDSSTSPTAYLNKLGLQEYPLLYRLFERDGAAIDIDALAHPEFRVILDKPLPDKTSRQVVVSNTPSLTKPTVQSESKAITEMTINELRSERKLLKSQINELDDPSDLIERLMELDDAINNLDITKPENLKVVQDEVIPETQHGTSPEVVKLTQQKLDIENEVINTGVRVQELELELARQKVQLEDALSRIEETADINPHDVISEPLPSGRARRVPTEIPPNDGTILTQKEAARFYDISEGNFKNGDTKPRPALVHTKHMVSDVVVPNDVIQREFDNIMNMGGITQPIVITPVGLDDVYIKYAVVDNHAIYEAAKLAREADPRKFENVNVIVIHPSKADPSYFADEVLPTNTTEGSLYHGTRVKGWTPGNGGVGEWGSGTYFSKSSQAASDNAIKPLRPALGEVIDNVTQPTIHEVLPDFKRTVDVNSPVDGDFSAALLMSANELMDGSEFTSFKRSIMKPGTVQLRDTIKTPADIYAAIEKYAAKNDIEWTPERTHKFKSRINERLRLVGVDALTDGDTTLVINPDAVSVINSHLLDETDAIGTSIARYNSASEAAGRNSGIPTANANQAEASVMLQRQMYEETIEKLEDAKRQQRTAITKSHEIDEQLTQTAQAEQTTKRQQRVAKSQKRAEREAERLGKKRDNPCQF
ncbi:tail protein [Anabaena phage A-4L]|uniref:Tail protein n=1 Tax=Anabaena phage A-4L TaxID=1357732 RepID=A0A059PY24_9CAUD|nr:tail protein [Anabaena phage A-4L]AGR48554.1 tail protein [Anabaena phage A-4L]